MMGLHANAVTQNCAAGVRACGIDRKNSDRALLFAIFAGKLIDQSAFASAGSAGKANDAGASGEVEKGFQQPARFRAVVFYCADGASQRAHVAGAYAVDPMLDCSW
jgi:hypothetical protein